jgi:tetratricopeptide (TPR) repeat protein
MLATLGYAYAASGREERAREILREIDGRIAEGRAAFAERGYVLTALGAIDAAVAEFERAYDARSGIVTYLKVEPMVDPLRAHPRFQALLRRMGVG